MSIGALTALALARAGLIALLAVIFSNAISGWLAAQRGRVSTLAWGLALAPYFTPALLVSYAYTRLALSLLTAPFGHEALYLTALTLKLTPIAILIRRLLPSPLSAEGRHTYRLLARPSSRWQRIAFRLRSAGAGPWIAGALVFLLAFADFELASLWGMPTWTMAIFDAQIGGVALSETLRLAAWPVGVQILVLALLAIPSRHLPSSSADGAMDRRRWPWAFLGVSAMLTSIGPLLFVATQSLPGWASLAANFVLTQEIAASLAFGLAGALGAELLARFCGKPGAILAAPGLLGALTISLLVLALFQVSFLRLAYDTPLPLAFALIVLLLPFALFLRALGPQPSPALHLARQTGSRRVLWPLETRPQFAAMSLLFTMAYFDFTASSILAPVGFTPVFVRLHNLAHYGQTAVLSAMLLAACAVPMLAILVTGLTIRQTTGRA